MDLESLFVRVAFVEDESGGIVLALQDRVFEGAFFSRQGLLRKLLQDLLGFINFVGFDLQVGQPEDQSRQN